MSQSHETLPVINGSLTVRWLATLPVRIYCKYSPIRRGKGRLYKHLVAPLLPPSPLGFRAELPAFGTVDLFFRESLAAAILSTGAFEAIELQTLLAYTELGTWSVDVGANLGYFTIPLSNAVGPSGTVLAIEPNPYNIARFKTNINRNEATNVILFEGAAADFNGSANLLLPDDGAFATTETALIDNREIEATVQVNATPLDSLWEAAGTPRVSSVKIDVEGGELSVLKGAITLIEFCRPAILVECQSDQDLSAVSDFLSPHCYKRKPTTGFMKWNHLFLPDSDSTVLRREPT